MSIVESSQHSEGSEINATPNRYIVLMGVSGTGKTSIGSAIASYLGTTFIDGDEYHPRANVEKIARGEVLTDRERWPWLALVGGAMRGHVARSEQAIKKAATQDELPKPRISEGCSIAACSSLRRAYRDYLAQQIGEPVFFVHLQGSRELIHSRMLRREGQFLPSQMLDSQIATQEPLEADEAGMTIDIDASIEELTDRIVQTIDVIR